MTPPNAPSAMTLACPLCDHAHEVRLETVRCGLCGAADEEELFTRGDLAVGLGGTFRVVRCRCCGLRYMNPRPVAADIHHFYPSSYLRFFYPAGEEKDGEILWRPWTWDRDLYRRCRAVMKRSGRGRVLDVGCGEGRFLRRLRDFGTFDVAGVELMPAAATRAREKYGVEVVAGSILDADLAPESFDVVTLWDVVEHLHQPLESLEKIARCLKPGGLLVLSTPSSDSLDARLFGRYWIGYELPRHLYYFSNRTLLALLKRAGFRVTGERVLCGGDYAFADEMRFLLRGRGWPLAVYGGATVCLRSRPWRWLLRPVFGLLALARWSTPRTFFCVKEG